jgi:hypothetical protein
MNGTSKPKPGDLLLDRYFPDADEVTRESARNAFRDFAAFILGIGERLITDENQPADSTKCDEGAKIEVAPCEPSP